MAAAKTTKAKEPAADKAANVWTDEERAAMQASAKERKASARRDPAEERAAGELEVKTKIAGMPTADRLMGERIHELVATRRRTLVPKTYYGMPAYAKDGKVICFYKPASKFKVRDWTFEFQPDARLDDGEMWPVGLRGDQADPARGCCPVPAAVGPRSSGCGLPDSSGVSSLDFVRFAHVEQHEIVAAVHSRFQLLDSDFSHVLLTRRGCLAALRGTTPQNCS